MRPAILTSLLLFSAYAGTACSDSGSTSGSADAAFALDAASSGDPGPDLGSVDAAGGDLANASGDAAAGTSMSFFVTSVGRGQGGDLRANAADADGLAGADAHCKALATAVSATLGAKTWRAYLSTSTVDARDRIGTGPWHNQKGVLIAQSVAALHEEGGATNALSFANSLDETGATVAGFGMGGNVHDILTGSGTDGRVMANTTCSDWTSSATNIVARVGHSDRMGGASSSWNSVHNSGGCGESGSGSVRTGGGRGSLYCFAL